MTEYSRGKGYKTLRHTITGCETFRAFAQGLAAEYKLEQQTSTSSHGNGSRCQTLDSGNRALQESQTAVVRPLYPTSAVQKYNRLADARRRLNSDLSHEKVKGGATYCSLCSYSETITFGKRKFQKKGGSKMVQWCSCCRPPVCSRGWETWHTQRNLVRASIPRHELIILREKARQSCS